MVDEAFLFHLHIILIIIVLIIDDSETCMVCVLSDFQVLMQVLIINFPVV